MNRKELIQQIATKQSFLCVGLDTDLSKIPAHVKDSEDPVFEFNKAIVDATHDLCVAYKPNIAFYESRGASGWKTLEKTAAYIYSKGNVLNIADAKRGDIGNTADMYANAFFTNMSFDAVTVNPYMGKDSVTPFLNHKDKWAIVLALTSNEGASDFQLQKTAEGNYVYESVLQKAMQWGTEANLMFVAGATRPQMLAELRKIVPSHFLLIPGVGAQGGNLQEVARNAMNQDCGILVNASRSILYAGNGKDFSSKARDEAAGMQKQMAVLLKEKGL